MRVKPTSQGDLHKMSDIIPTEEVEDTPLGMFYTRGTVVHFWKSPTYHLGNITRCRVSLAHTRHIYKHDQRLRRTEVEA